MDGMNGTAPIPRSVIRCVTEDDTAWLHALGAQRYPDGTYDPEAAERWIKSLMHSPNHLMLRGEKAWVAAWVQSVPYRPTHKTGHFMVVASLGNATRELCDMTRIVIEWAKSKGVSVQYWAAINGTDFGPIARWFGAEPVSPSYKLELDHHV